MVQGTRKYSTPKGVIPHTTHPGYVAAVNSINPIVTHSFRVNDPCYYAPCVERALFHFNKRGTLSFHSAWGWRGEDEFQAYFCSIEHHVRSRRKHARLGSQTRAPGPARLRLDDAGGYTWECGARKSRR